MLDMLRNKLRELLERRKALMTERDAITAKVEAEKRDALTDAETALFNEKRAAIAAVDAETAPLQERIAELEEQEKRDAAANAAMAAVGAAPASRGVGGAVVTSEPQTYGKYSGRSYFHDLAKAQVHRDPGAVARLERHEAELRVELPAREARRAARAATQMDELATMERWSQDQRAAAFEQRVNPNRTDGQGGYFVPPLWLIDEYIELPRFGRPFSNSIRNLELPPGTDSINLPKVSTGTATAAQTADGGSVQSTDLTDTFVSASVYTVAGQQDVALQLLDQSPAPGFDAITFGDLMADLEMRQEIYSFNGSGASGQPTGALNVGSINSQTYTDASPTLAELWPYWVQSESAIFTNRKMPALATFCQPAHWFWGAASFASDNRPLFVPESHGPFNALALQTGAIAEGPVGKLVTGLPVILAGNIPTNLGAGTNETRIVTARTSDLYLWEGATNTRVLQEVLSGTLQVRFQVYRYAALMCDRLPKAISVVSGTGLIPPSGY